MIARPDLSRHEPLSSRICEIGCLAFALWTLCSHSVVALGGNLSWLVGLYAVAAVAAAFGWRGVQRRGGLQTVALPESQAPPRSAALRGAQLGLGGAGVVGVVLASRLDAAIPLWGALVAVLGAAWVAFALLEAPRVEAPRIGRPLEIGLWVTALLCGVYALVVHRPDADDAFYLNLAVAAVDRPELPLLAVDTLHGRGDLPIHYPAYRLHSYELANAAVSLLSGIPVIYVFHWIAAGLAAACVPLCQAVLHRLLVPRTWLAATLAFVFVLGFVGEAHRWYGNFAFVRLWQGKGVFLFLFLPLVYAYAIRFALRPTGRHWLLLAAAQIGAVGCSSTAVWAAPLAAGLAMASVLRPDLEGLRRAGIGVLSSAYVLGIGLLLKRDMAGHTPTLKRIFEPGELFELAVGRTLGLHELQLVCLVAVAVTWACQRPGLAQRFAIVVPFAVLLLLLDPFTDSFVRANLTGPSYWRAMWSLPIPLLLALILTAPLQIEGRRRGLGIAAAASACLAFALFVPRTTGWGESNQARLAWPQLKVVPNMYRWAGILNERAPGQRVLAPPGINTWIPTFHHHAYPLMVRVYLRPSRAKIGEVAYRDRYVMTRYVAGDAVSEQAPAILARGLDLYDVQIVCIRRSELAPGQRKILRGHGYRRTVQGQEYEVWERAKAAPGEAGGGRAPAAAISSS